MILTICPGKDGDVGELIIEGKDNPAGEEVWAEVMALVPEAIVSARIVERNCPMNAVEQSNVITTTDNMLAELINLKR